MQTEDIESDFNEIITESPYFQGKKKTRGIQKPIQTWPEKNLLFTLQVQYHGNGKNIKAAREMLENQVTTKMVPGPMTSERSK